jgi:hypothetical protein
VNEETEALRDVNIAQDALAKHRSACSTCWKTCSAMRYCATGKTLYAEIKIMLDRYFKVREESR